MAREAYRSLYGDIKKLKDTSFLGDPAGGTGSDDELFQLLMASSEWTDRYCNRHFYPRTQTLEFDVPQATKRLIIPDLISITSLKADDNADATYEVTWATTDYYLEPFNAEPTEHWGRPYTSIRARDGGAIKTFKQGEKNIEIVGSWGFKQYKEDSASNINNVGGYSSTATSVIVTAGTDFAIGQTILMGTEQALITNIATNTLTIVRGMNGTTAAAQADALDVYIIRFPLCVERATLINAARLWTRAPNFEPFYVDSDTDPDIEALLAPYVRFEV